MAEFLSAAPEAEPEGSSPKEFRDMLSFPFVSCGGSSSDAELHMPGQFPLFLIMRRKGIIFCKGDEARSGRAAKGGAPGEKRLEWAGTGRSGIYPRQER